MQKQTAIQSFPLAKIRYYDDKKFPCYLRQDVPKIL